MAFLNINPCYQPLLEQIGLTTPELFLEMPSVIIGGHPDRNVARSTLGTGPGAIAAFLKREHRVPWKERLLNSLARFGFVSKSRREAMTLHDLKQAGVPCPDWIAVGEDGQGRAFLLLREVTGSRDLRVFLQEHRQAPSDQRRRFAYQLGEALAKFHNAGFDHPDLFAKHVLVNPQDYALSFLDWQRSRRRRRVTWRRRCRDLAALEATLAEDLATVRERLECLRAYLRTSRMRSEQGRTRLASSVAQIHHLAIRLLRQRRIQELRHVPVDGAAPALVWQDGEALCLTPEFQCDLEGRMPYWLVLASGSSERRALCPPCGTAVQGTRGCPTAGINPAARSSVPQYARNGRETHSWVDLPDERRALLVRRRSHSLRGLWSWLRRCPAASPELRRAGLLFRLERYGIRVPRLLAVGQRAVKGWRTDSFLLTEPPPDAVPLREWLTDRAAEFRQRRHVIGEAANLLRRLHTLHCYLGGQCRLAVVPSNATAANIVLASIDAVYRLRRSSKRAALRDLATCYRELSTGACGRTDGLRFLLGYLGLQRSNPTVKRLIRCLGYRQMFHFQLPLLRLHTSPNPKPRTQGALP
jgi:tRNA A-37 threonylcarbamoyl transferase component Bud32